MEIEIDTPGLSDNDEIEEAMKEANGDLSETDLESELESTAAESGEEETKEEEAEKKVERAVLVPVSIRVSKEELMTWFKTFDVLESYVIFTTAGSNFVEIIGFDAPHRISVSTKISNLETEAIRKAVTQTGYIPLSNKKETLFRHLNVISGKVVDILFDGKDITIKSGEEESTFTPEADQVDEAIAMKGLFNGKITDEKIEALQVTYSNYMRFGEKFVDFASRWERYGRDYMAFVVDGNKVKCRFISDMNDVKGKSGATVSVEPEKISAKGNYVITFTGLSVSPMKKTAAEEEITIFFFSDDHPYIVMTKSGKTMMVIASTVESKNNEET